MSIVDKFVSITDVRRNASFYINNINKNWEKIILVNNKPKAVLIDIKIYEQLIEKNNIEFESLEWSSETLWTKEHNTLLSLMRKA